MRRSLFDALAPVMFVVGGLVLAVCYGFFAASYGLFPAGPLRRAEESARGIWEAYVRPPPFDRVGRDGTPGRSTAFLRLPDRQEDGVTLVVGYRPEGFGAWIVDADGNVLHRWAATFSGVFGNPAPHLQYQARDITIAWHGVHLFANGDLLFNFQDNSFPYGSGLVKLDKDGRSIWKLNRNTHHAVTVEPDGTIWVPSQHYRPDGLPGVRYLKPWYYEDTVLKVSPDGEVLDEISVLKAFAGVPGAFSVTYADADKTSVAQPDPLHLNDVEPLPAAWADRFPQFSPGDLLVSLRNMNTIAVIDSMTKRVKWQLSCLFVRQHDADFLPNGHLMVYDNQGGDQACGGSRILEIDPVTQSTVWKYDGCGEKPFFSLTRGVQNRLANGNVLTVEPHAGRVLEVTGDAQPRLVWEYYNVLTDGAAEPRVGLVTHAERFRCEDLPFLTGPTS
jgi:hypothetical protein